jgi:hypothetical protein
MANLYLGLVHYPIYNKNMKVVATAVTNFDIHDISRTARTYDVKRYFLIHPLDEQKKIITKITDYWQNGFGQVYNPDRSNALERVSYIPSIGNAIDEIEKIEGTKPITITTDARKYENTVSYGFVRNLLKEGSQPILLLFGTGFGIEKTVMGSFDYILEPIYGPCDYNHLCVRSAAAIIIDRIAGEQWWLK